MTSLGQERTGPKISIKQTTVTRDSIVATAAGLDMAHLDRLRAASCIIVPEPGRGKYVGPLFFGTAPDLLRYFDAHSLPAEIPVRDEDYKELALHADTAWLGLLWVQREEAVALVKLIALWIRQTYGAYVRSKHIDVSLAVQDGATSKIVKYEGPADKFEDVMQTAVKGLNDLNRP